MILPKPLKDVNIFNMSLKGETDIPKPERYSKTLTHQIFLTHTYKPIHTNIIHIQNPDIPFFACVSNDQ